ncbi:uncharacterized protein JCM10292_000495 [Rhodotorula paludigena]|uniref:uncharacterized protein n=1 Tax=Rhodotorula paludigena TaxID=86838 RepID=UPI0031730C9B
MKFLALASLAGTLAAAQIHRVPAAPGGHDLARRQAATSATATATGSATRTGAASASISQTSVPTGSVPSKPLASLSRIGTATTSEATQPLPSTFSAGATPPVSGAPALPTISTLNPANYPALDVIPPLDSPEMKQWLSEIDLENIPNYGPTGLNGCSNATNAEALAQAGGEGRCWWTCGGCTRATDITYCPTKEDWGASFDDGPSPYTPRLLNLLEQQNLKSTFFIVGSRAISRPEMVQTEYMLGHQLSVHTWAHSSLTTLSNEEIVAELGWTKKIIKDITGVTPNTFRPPYGDIDDRVRYIALQMGLRPIIWTQQGDKLFDTEDWQIGGGRVSAVDAYNNFISFVDTASQSLPHGFIVLAHDLYQQSVDLAVDYVLPHILNQGVLNVKTIAQCLGESLEDSYIETSNQSLADIVQTQSTVVGATGTGFAPDVGLIAASTGAVGPSGTAGQSNPAASGGAQGASQTNSPGSGAQALKVALAGMLGAVGLAAVVMA